jgi:tetratricopeptide (TPR) repeat protein
MGEDMWTFEYPRLSAKVYDEFYEAIDLWHMGQEGLAEQELRRLVDAFPEFIDAHHHLALLLEEAGREREAFQIWREVVSLGLNCLPEEFETSQGHLPWFILENRPFLRVYHALGLEVLENGEVERALAIFLEILAMNPNDNQGVRELAIGCYFALGRPEGALEICGRYPDDALEGVMYGRALALYQLGREEKARGALLQAIEAMPLIARELVKKRHRRPKDLDPAHVTYGGADQAYYYWVDQGQYWSETPGAIEFVRACL